MGVSRPVSTDELSPIKSTKSTDRHYAVMGKKKQCLKTIGVKKYYYAGLFYAAKIVKLLIFCSIRRLRVATPL